MNRVVAVKLWGTTVGYLAYEPGQTEIATYEHDAAFSRSGIQLSPLTMPHPPLLHRFDAISRRTFKGVPGIIADSLPDNFGRQLIDLFMAERGKAVGQAGWVCLGRRAGVRGALQPEGGADPGDHRRDDRRVRRVWPAGEAAGR